MYKSFSSPRCVRRAVTAGLLLALAGSALPASAFASPETELAAARSQLEQIGSEYQQLSENLETLRGDLETTVKQVEETSAELETSQADLAQLVSNGYKDGGLTVVKLLFGSTDLNDIISGVYYLGKVSNAKAEAIEEVKTLQTVLEMKQSEQTAAMDSAEERLNQQAENQQRAIELVNSLDAQVRAQLEAEAQQNQAIASGIQSAEDGEAAMVEGEAQTPSAPAAEGNEGNAGDAGQDDEPSAPSEPTQQPQTPSAPADEPDAPEPEAPEPEPEPEPESPSGGGSTTGSSSVGGAAVSIALQFQGYPYTWGGASPEEGFDCSGLVMYAYAQLGYSLPHSSSSQLTYIQNHGRFTTDKSQLQYGDLVFFPGHVAFYVGNGMVFGARRPGVGASTAPLSYYSTFLGGGNL